MRVQLRAREDDEALCPLCRVELAARVIACETCSACGVAYHADCLSELGGCATLGCTRREEERAESREQEARREVLAERQRERIREAERVLDPEGTCALLGLLVVGGVASAALAAAGSGGLAGVVLVGFVILGVTAWRRGW